MALTRLREITGSFYTPEGDPASGETLKIELTKNDYSTVEQATVERFEVTITLDGNGLIPAATELWTNADGMTGSYYMVTEPDGTLWYFSLALGDDSPIDITTLRVAGSPMANVNPVYNYIDERLGANILDYNESLTDAVTAIGADEVCLRINTPISVTSTLEVPENIIVEFCDDGLLTVTSGNTVTIRSLAPHISRQLFAGAGTVLVGGVSNPISEINLAWWAGASNNSDVTHQLTQAVSSLSAMQGGALLIPSGTWKTTGGRFDPTTSTFTNNGIFLPDHCELRGQGMDSDASQGTVIELTDTDANAFILCPAGGGATQPLRGNFRGITISNLTFKCPAATGRAMILTGQNPFSGFNVTLTNVGFYQGDYGLAILDNADSNDWEVVGVSLRNCVFAYQDIAGFYCNTTNTQIAMDSPTFLILGGKVGMLCANIGMLKISSHDARGAGGILYDSGQAGDYAILPNSSMADAFIRITGTHNQIYMENGWDEAIGYSIDVTGGGYESPIVAVANVFQGYIRFNNVSTAFTSISNILMHEQFRDGVAASTSRVYSYADYIQDRAVHQLGSIGATRRIDDFVGSSQIHFNQRTVDTGIDVQTGDSVKIDHNGNIHFTTPLTTPNIAVGSTADDKVLLRLGKLNSSTLAQEHYADFLRNGTGDTLEGVFDFVGSQTGLAGLRIFGRAATPTVSTLTDGASIDVDCKLGNIFIMTLTQSCTVNFVDIIEGQEVILLLEDHSSTVTVTWGTGVKPASATVVTAGDNSKQYLLHFIGIRDVNDSNAVRAWELTTTPTPSR